LFNRIFSVLNLALRCALLGHAFNDGTQTHEAASDCRGASASSTTATSSAAATSNDAAAARGAISNAVTRPHGRRLGEGNSWSRKCYQQHRQLSLLVHDDPSRQPGK
jgi:hypothetical protein